MLPFLLLASALSAEPTPEQTVLLKTFREEFVAISPGTGRYPQSFRMGRDDGPAVERPAHDVTLTKTFSMAKYEVPQNLWEGVMGSNPSKWKGKRNSVEMLSFAEAEEFCKKATEMMRAAKLINAKQVIRLPSEAEWEYCARAGTTTLYSFGDDPKELTHYAWYTANAAGNDPPVGAKKPNPWGLYDMHGYLLEWCSDTVHASYDGAPVDGSAWVTKGKEGQRVLRGGSWRDEADGLTCTYRVATKADSRSEAIGLRCVLAEE